MAANDNTVAGLTFGPPGGGKKPKRKRPAKGLTRPAPAERLSQTLTGRSRPAPALSVGREKTKPRDAALYERYGIVFDPEAEDSPVTKAERDALVELYREQTGRELDTEPSVRDALERSGLIRSGAFRGARQLESLRGRDFVSATDALDALREAAGPAFERASRLTTLGQVVGLGAAAATPEGEEVMRRAVGEEPFYEAPVVRRVVGDVGRALRTIDEAAAPVTRPVAEGISAGIESLRPGEPVAARGFGEVSRRAAESDTSLRDVVGGVLGGTVGRLGDVPLPVPNVAGLQMFATPSGRVFSPKSEQPTFGDISDFYVDLSQNPEKYVQATSGIDVAAEVPNAPEWVKLKIQEAMAGQPASSLSLVPRDESPFSAEDDERMRVLARRNGWRDDEWGRLSIDERIYRAVNRKDNAALLFRSFARNIGEIGAAPAGIKAIVEAAGDAVFDGDTEQALFVFEAALSPYVQGLRVYRDRGFWAAAGEFIRDNPTEAILIFNTAVRTASRGGGAAARAGALGERARGFAQTGREITIQGPTVSRVPQRPVTAEAPELPTVRSGADLLAQVRAREAARAEQRRVDAENARLEREYEARRRVYEETGEMEEVSAPIAVGRVGRGILAPAVLQYVKAPIADRFPRYRNRILRNSSKREQRLSGNVAQGEDIEVRRILERALGGGVDERTRSRAVFDLIFPAVDYEGRAVTPAYVADFFRAELNQLRAQMAESPGRPRAEDVQFQRRLEDTIARYDEIENVRLDPEVAARLRAEAKRLGEVNDRRFAKMMGISLAEAKRANYIRLIAMDRAQGRGMEVEARARAATRNAAIKGLRSSQKKIRQSSRRIQEYASESGWGKYGPARSRLAFNSERSKLVRELRRAERFARQYGDDALADSYRASRRSLAASRISSRAQRDATGRVVDDLVNLRVADEAAEAFPEAARVPYERAAARIGEAASLREQMSVELGRAGVRKTTSRTVAQAEDRVVRANDDLESYLALPNPDSRVIARKQEKLQREIEKRDAVSRAEALRGRVKEAEKRRDRAIRKAITASNKKVLDEPTLRAALDESESYANIEVKGRKDLFWRIDRVRDEVLDEFIARVEALDQNPVLHLVQTPDYDRVGRATVVEGDKLLQGAPRGFITPGRLKSSDGYLFVSAQESAKVWDNLLRNTSEVTTASVLQERLDSLVRATSIPFRFSNDAIVEARRIADTDEALQARVASGDLTPDGAEREALARVLRDPAFVGERADIDVNEFVVLNLSKPSARRPSERLSFGVSRSGTEANNLGEFALRTIDSRTLDPNAPGTYYLMPRAVYDGIQKAIRDEAFQFSQSGLKLGARADRIVRLWRTITLNVLPRTAINNTIGSTILAIQAGAGPRAFWYAANALAGRAVRVEGGERRVLPVPPELRQRYYEQLTDPVARRRRPGDFSRPTPFDFVASWAGWWMNSMRTMNGLSEDFGRLATWYHHAYPTAMRDASSKRFFLSARSLNDSAVEMLEGMARRDENYQALSEAFMQKSFDFLGDLHRGGRGPSVLRIAIPFWQWYAHMLKLTFFTMPFKYPGRALFIEQLANIGREYQRAHGMMLPWGQEFVPFAIVEAEVAGRQQEIVQGVGVGGWWPQATTSIIGTETGELRALDFGISAITPFWSNAALIGLAFATASAGGSAKEFDDQDFVRSVQDEYGLEIERVRSESFVKFVANRLMRMFPLSPTIMSQAGRASTALPLPGEIVPRETESLQLPDELRQQQRADVAAVIDDWRANLPAALLKAGIGLPINYMPGRGPITWQRWIRDFEYQIRQKTREDKAIADALREIHQAPEITGLNR